MNTGVRSGEFYFRTHAWALFLFRKRLNELACLLACVDTAENEPLEVWGKIIQYYSFVSLVSDRACGP